jgi:hypothetical protein
VKPLRRSAHSRGARAGSIIRSTCSPGSPAVTSAAEPCRVSAEEWGCRRAWQEGASACPNRLTIRIKVAEPQIFAKLQGELLEPATLDYIAKAVEREAKRALNGNGKASRPDDIRKRLEQERRKLQNLVAALEEGSDAPAAILKAIAEREKTVTQLEGELRQASTPRQQRDLGDMSAFVKRQLADLTALLRTDVPRAKSEFRRLNLALTFHPTEAKPRPYYVVKGQCDLSALAFSRFVPADPPPYRWIHRDRVSSASLDLSGEQSGAVTARLCRRFAASDRGSDRSTAAPQFY